MKQSFIDGAIQYTSISVATWMYSTNECQKCKQDWKYLIALGMIHKYNNLSLPAYRWYISNLSFVFEGQYVYSIYT